MPPKNPTASRKRGPAIVSGASQAKKPINMEREISIDFNDSKISHDRVIVVEGRKFYVVSGLLALYSNHFNALFKDEADKDNDIDLKDVNADDFKNFLCVLCPGKDGLNENNVRGALMLAHRFEVPLAWQKCWDFILQEKNVRDGIVFAVLTWMAEKQIAITTKLEQKVSSSLGKIKYEQFAYGVFKSGLETVNKHNLNVIKTSMDKVVLKKSKVKETHWKHKYKLPPSPEWLGIAVDYNLELTTEYYVKFYSDLPYFELEKFFADFWDVVPQLSLTARLFVHENISDVGKDYDPAWCAGFPNH